MAEDLKLEMVHTEGLLVSGFHRRLVAIGAARLPGGRQRVGDPRHSGLTIALTAEEIAGAVKKDPAGGHAFLTYHLLNETSGGMTGVSQVTLGRFVETVKVQGGGTGATLGQCLASALDMALAVTIHQTGFFCTFRMRHLFAALADQENYARSLVLRIPLVGQTYVHAFDVALEKQQRKQAQDEKARLAEEDRAVAQDRSAIKENERLYLRGGRTWAEWRKLFCLVYGPMNFSETGKAEEATLARVTQKYGAGDLEKIRAEVRAEEACGCISPAAPESSEAPAPDPESKGAKSRSRTFRKPGEAK